MQYKGLKKKIVDFINCVVEDRFKEISEREEHGQKKMSEIVRQVQNLEENVRNINDQLAGLEEIKNRLVTLEENVRVNNARLDLLNEIDKRIHILEENLRNNNVQLEGLNAVNTRLQVLEENVRVNNARLDLLKETNQRLQIVEENTRNNNNTLSKILKDNSVCVLEAKVEALKNSISRLQEMSITTAEASADNVPVNISNNAYEELDYFSFENYFRGEESQIKERQKIYLPYFQGCNNVLDLGCGRGEFLELLKENNIKSTGVDYYEEFAIYDKNKGLDVVNGDAISYLENLPGKVDGIFAGQLVEHLTVGQIMALCRLAFDRLEEGKYLIMETPNPMSLAIYTHAFYIDPSHQKPVHPLTLKYFAEKAGFKDVQILFPEASKLQEGIPKLEGDNITNLDEFNASMQRVSEYLYGSQDYAIIAKKEK